MICTYTDDFNDLIRRDMCALLQLVVKSNETNTQKSRTNKIILYHRETCFSSFFFDIFRRL